MQVLLMDYTSERVFEESLTRLLAGTANLRTTGADYQAVEAPPEIIVLHSASRDWGTIIAGLPATSIILVVSRKPQFSEGTNINRNNLYWADRWCQQNGYQDNMFIPRHLSSDGNEALLKFISQVMP